MCTISRTNPELKIAEEDIVVYKEGTIIEKRKIFFWKQKVFISGIKDFEYEFNKVYKTKLDSFKKFQDSDFYYSEKGFYSYKDFPLFLINNIVKCIIPKGSKYYLTQNIFKLRGIIYNCEYVYHSDQIKILDENRNS